MVADDVSFARHSLVRYTMRWADNDRLREVHVQLGTAIAALDDALETLQRDHGVRGRWS
jgi:hypothetical protein